MAKNFMIGLHGSYDTVKYSRDFRKGFFGVQACLLPDDEAIENLAREATDKSFQLGIHFPLRGWTTKHRDPLFLSLDATTRKDAYQSIEDELEYLSEKSIKVDYILFHYPKPVVLKPDFDMSSWRFADPSEFVYESNYSLDFLKMQSEILFKWLSEKSKEFNFTPVLELDGLNKYICNDGFLEALLEKYPVIKICLDTGRLHLQDKIDSNFDAIGIIDRFAKYTEVVHLWNAKIQGTLENNHYPVLKEQKTEDGWAPIDQYLDIIVRQNNAVKIMFEHRSELISDEQLDQCYEWVGSFLANGN